MDKRRRDPSVPGQRSTFVFNPPPEICAQLERIVRECDMSANAVITRLVEAALPRVQLKNRVVKDLVIDDLFRQDDQTA